MEIWCELKMITIFLKYRKNNLFAFHIYLTHIYTVNSFIMKKKVYLLSTALMLAFSTTQLKAATIITEPVAKETTLTDAQKEAKLQAIKARVEEIKAMDKSQLSKEEKKEVKAELKTMKAQANAMGGGVYLSVGAIIIIILLLILIL